ncbi:MAG: hypothetical protein OYH76_23495 [Defluviicoccus sp.]|nr:hypothetical protein [Defluviicoccus sp.]MDE0278871.1 hypothetical protein [Defluviicoccus sp.]
MLLAALVLPAAALVAGSSAQDRAPAGDPGSVAIPPPVSVRAPSGDAAPAPTAAAAARARANDDMDRLRSEIRLLTELHAAQKALGDWNRLRVAAGEPAAKLDPALCGALAKWCRALPGTFGRGREGGGS